MNRKDSIIVFNRRKQIEKAAKNIFNLNGIRVIENLCPESRRLFNRCFKLKKQDKIEYVSTTNGNIYIQMHGYENDLLIEHSDDINYYIEESTRLVYDELQETFVSPNDLLN